jgi:hypothetical protein
MAIASGDEVAVVGAPPANLGGPPGKQRSLAWTALVVISYVVLSVALYWHEWSGGVTTHLQAGGDQYATVWFLRWIPFSLGHGANPFFSTYGNYPFGVNLLTNTSVPLLGLLGTPLTLAFGPIATYNVMCTAALAGSATAGYAFARTWTAWRPAAWVGGLLYGFSPYEIAQSNGGHLNLTFVVLPPLILLSLNRVVTGRGRAGASGIVLGLLVVLQFFISSEVLASTLVVGAICLVGSAIIGHRTVGTYVRRAAIGCGWALSTAAILLAYPIWFVLRGPGHISGPIQLVPNAYRADLLGPLVPNTYTWLAPASLVRTADAFANSTAENGSYLGITLTVTVLIGIVVLWRSSQAVRVAAVGGAAAFILSLGGALSVSGAPGAYLHGLPLPERVFAKLPLLSNTVAVRYSLYVALFASLILAIVLDRSWSAVASGAHRAHSMRSGRRLVAPVAVVILAAICLIPVIPDIPIGAAATATTPSYFTSQSLARTPRGQVSVIFPFPSSVVPDAQLWQAEAAMHFKTPGGYFLVPEGRNRALAFSAVLSYGQDTLTARVFTLLYLGRPPAQTPALRAALLAQFHAWHVSTLVASMDHVSTPARSLAFLSWLVGRPPVTDVDVDVWRQLPD